MLHIKSIKPMFTSIVTTADRFEEDYTENGMILASKGDYKPWQTIISIGDSVRNLKKGDKVMVNLDNYVVRKYDKNSLQNDLDNNKKVRYAFNFVTLDDNNGNPRQCRIGPERNIFRYHAPLHQVGVNQSVIGKQLGNVKQGNKLRDCDSHNQNGSPHLLKLDSLFINQNCNSHSQEIIQEGCKKCPNQCPAQDTEESTSETVRAER